MYRILINGIKLSEMQNRLKKKFDFNALSVGFAKGKGRHLILFGMIVLLSACIQGEPLTEKKMATIQTVNINPDFQKPKKIDFQFQQRGGSSGSSWGAILASAVKEGAKSASKSSGFRNAYRKSGISIDLILKEQFENELKKSDLFGSVDPSNGDAEFQLQIQRYGFEESLLTTYMKPMLWIKAMLVTPDGTILWDQQIHCCSAEKEVHSHPQRELYHDQQLMRLSLTSAANASSVRLIEDMQRDLAGN